MCGVHGLSFSTLGFPPGFFMHLSYPVVTVLLEFLDPVNYTFVL